MFTYTAKTNGEGIAYQLAPGYYEARIHEAEEGRSSAGNDVIWLTLWVLGPEGYVTIKESLVFMDSVLWKVDQFVKALGREVEPGKQIVIDAAQLVGRTLWVKTKEEESVSKKDGKTYINPRVDRYLLAEKVPFQGPIAQQQSAAPAAPARSAAAPVNSSGYQHAQAAQQPTHFGYDKYGRRIEGNSPSTMQPAATMPHEEDDDIPF